MKGWGPVAFLLLYVIPLSVVCGGLGVWLLRKFEKDAEEWAAKINKDLDGGGHA